LTIQAAVKQMLEWTQAGPGARLLMLVRLFFASLVRK
jgi:hypothetical protein